MRINSSKCRCCGNSMTGEPFCKVCGMTPVSVTDSNLDLDTPARDYIKRRFKGGTIELKCYTYDLDRSDASEPQVHYKSLCSLDSYWVGETVKLPCDFESIPTKNSFSVCVKINLNGKSEEKEIRIVPDRETSRKLVSIEFMPCLRARLVIGDDNVRVYSEEFDVAI